MKKSETFQKCIKYFNNLRFKQKLILSYVLIGVVPFCIFACILYVRTERSMKQAVETGFENVFATQLDAIQTRVERIENAMELICVDDAVIRVATMPYTNEYSKYVDIAGRFDSALQSLLLMNSELSSYQLYLSNNLIGTRSNFLSLENLKDTEMYEVLQSTYQSQWFWKEGDLLLARKIYNVSNKNDFAVLVLNVSYEEMFSNLENVMYQVVLRDIPVYQMEPEIEKEDYLKKKASIMSGAGSFSMYMDRSEAEKENQDTLLMFVLLISGSSVILLVLINAFSNAFVRRINRINNYFSRAVKEKFAITIPVDYQDEIGEMTEHVNAMIAETRHNIYDVYRSRLKQREYEIKALQAQINPHFLYNTLSAVNWFALQSEDERISGIVTSLAKFYRTALNNGENITTIKSEIENIQAYLDIQLRIHGNSFDVEYEIDSEVMDYNMPHLILQPVVENAVEHGIDRKEDGRGQLFIRIYSTEDAILFEIRDNGPGMSEEILEGLLKKKKSGYGLRNVNKRLELFFGTEYEFRFDCTEETCCYMRIPKRLDMLQQESQSVD